MTKDQVGHILKLMELSIMYVSDCDGPCTSCPLDVEPMSHTSDLPELPPGLNVCNLFDYISQTIEINEAPNIK